MIKYVVVLDKPNITLKLMGRKKTFKNGEEVNECAYTKAYPKHFSRIGEVKGYYNHLNTPLFVPDQISDFLQKEVVRKEEKIIREQENPSEKQEERVVPLQVEIDELALAAEEFIKKLDDL